MQEDLDPIEKPSTRETGTRYGLILGCISVLYFITLAVTNVNMTEGVGRWGGLLFTIVIFVFAHKHFKENGDGFMTMSQGVGISFWASLVSSVISSAFTFVYVKFIDQGFLQSLRDQQYDQMLEQGLSETQIEQALSFSAPFMTPSALVLIGVFSGVFMGLIVGLIISLFTQKKNPDLII